MSDEDSPRNQEASMVAHLMILSGGILATVGLWMFMDGGGTLVRMPNNMVWIAPTVTGVALSIGGFLKP